MNGPTGMFYPSVKNPIISGSGMIYSQDTYSQNILFLIIISTLTYLFIYSWFILINIFISAAHESIIPDDSNKDLTDKEINSLILRQFIFCILVSLFYAMYLKYV